MRGAAAGTVGKYTYSTAVYDRERPFAAFGTEHGRQIPAAGFLSANPAGSGKSVVAL